ncbi:MAG: molybdopterin-dependent oxidoreductase [Candidatus Bathyarchaeota archaeon]|nr:molybdopterin-dependent oxidoreductase [Candidatus Bathyarchaeota archaeon]
MQNVKSRKSLLTIAFVAVLILAVSMALVIQILPSLEPKKLYPAEVREYQGENLSSISDFRENSILGPQQVDITTYQLTITGLVNKTVTYTYDQILNQFDKYQKVVTLHCVEGWSVTIFWEGFLVSDLLKEAGIKPEAVGVVFRAYDGYATELPLEYINDKQILMAYKMNDLVLPPERGFPFELVAESQAGYKWIKWITTIELTDNPNFLGYWESRGYPNNATIPEP